MHTSLLLILIVLNFVDLINCRCNSFETITVELESRDGESHYEDIEGCVDPTTANRNTARVIVREEYVPNLKYGAVQNLAQVRDIEFMNCSTEIIEAGAFRNLPRLNEIIIKFNNIELIPRGVFNDFSTLHTIRINNNGIKVIEDRAFTNLPKLRLLFVFENKIETWRPTWFINTTALEDLHFEDNIIKRIPKNAFKNLNKLQRIWLNFNDISVIESGAFQGLKHLDYLGLRNNLLKTIEPDIFPSRLTIDTFYIDANKLNYLANEVLNKIKVKVLSMQGNPWKCPCLERIYFWLRQNNGTLEEYIYCKDKNVPICAYPEIYSDTCLEYVDDSVTKEFLRLIQVQTEGIDVFTWERCVRFD